MRKYDIYFTSTNGSYGDETSREYESTVLDPVVEDPEEDVDVPDAKHKHGRKQSRLVRIFSKFRQRKTLARNPLYKASSTRAEPGSATSITPPDIARPETRDDDTSTVAVDNTTANKNLTPILQIIEEDRDTEHEEYKADECDDSCPFLDDFSTTALASLPDEQSPVLRSSQTEDIWMACKIGDEEFVEAIISHEPGAIHELQDGRTPLYFASLCGHESIVRMLLESGASDHDRTAELSALTQVIRTMLKKNRKRLATEAISKVASIDNSCRLPTARATSNIISSSIPDSDILRAEEILMLPQISSLSTSSYASSSSASTDDRSCSKQLTKAPSTVRRLIPRIPAKILKNDGLFDPKKFSLPDLSSEYNDQLNRKTKKKKPASSTVFKEPKSEARNLQLLENGIQSSCQPQIQNGALEDVLATSFIDCSEVVLPDLFFEAPPVEAYDQSEGALHEEETAGLASPESTIGSVRANAKNDKALDSELPEVTYTRTYDAKELLPRQENQEKDLPTLKASVCGVTAVLEEEVDEKRPKMMMSWVESHQLKSHADDLLSFDSEDAMLNRNDNSLDGDDIGFLSMLRDCVCQAYESFSGETVKD